MRKSQQLKTLVLLLGLLILIGGGGYGYIWYTVKSDLDSRIAAAKPMVDITYDGFTVSPLGTLELKKVKFFIPDIADSVYASRISISSDDIFTLMTMMSGQKLSQPPVMLDLKLDNLRLYLNGNIAQLMASNAEQAPLAQVETLVCGGTPYIGLKELEAMGYKELALDMQFHYQYHPRNKHLNFIVQSNLRDFINMRMSGTVEGVDSLTTQMSASPPKLTQLDVEYTEDLYTSRRNALCAKRSGIEVSEYVVRQAYTAYDYLEQLGITLGPGLKQFYKEHLRTSGDIRLSMRPGELFEELHNLHLYKPAELFDMLNLELTLDGKRYDDLSIQFNQQKLTASLLPGTQADGQGNQSADNTNGESSLPGVAPPAPVYQVIAPAKWSLQLGEHVIITTNDGATMEGVLKSIDDKTVNLESRMRAGKATFHLQKSKIVRLEGIPKKRS